MINSDTFSKWHGVDLHIHSIKSNEVKPNDYEGGSFSGNDLLEKLLENDISIFSITDHNSINLSLYDELSDLVNSDKYKNRINYIIGVELDVKDTDIYNDVFHCLTLFETKDANLINKAIYELFDKKKESERNEDSIFPSINKIFSVFNKHGIQNMILIPHYRDKDKGISYKNEDANKLLIYLNKLCFNAYEDSNNVVLLSKSLKCYMDYNCDFPFVAFSDNHNLRKYPSGKNKSDKNTKCYMLSNINYPFNSVKTAFEEPRLRISLDGVVNTRLHHSNNKYIESFSIGNNEIKLSPYCNIIIGRFGSGKTLLMRKIIAGNKGLKDDSHYKDLFDSQPSFQIRINNSSYESIENSGGLLKWYELAQKEEYSYKSYFGYKELQSLFKKFKLNYECAEDIVFNINTKDILDSYNKFKESLKDKSAINNLNFEKAFRNEEFYNVPIGTNFDIQKVIDLLSDNNNLTSIIEAKIDNINVFAESEIELLEKASKIIERKKEMLNLYSKYDAYKQMEDLIQEYNDLYINNIDKQKCNKLITDFNALSKNTINFCNKICTLYSVLKKSKYEEIVGPIKTELFGPYTVEKTYESSETFPELIDIFASGNSKKEDLFKTVLFIENNDLKYRANGTFEKCLNNYSNKVNGLFKKENAKYDIYKGETSLLKKSAGEKASLFMELLFELIKKDIDSNESIVLFLDQPENDIDNKNIYETVTKKITELKKQSVNFQCIIVTHNGNVGIGIDSENILIANEKLMNGNEKQFDYRSGCIENTVFIKGVCDILEGGKEAMIKRTSKYGINIIKKVTENEA